MQIERGWMGAIPYAAVGAGQPLVLLAGLSPVAGEAGDGLVHRGRCRLTWVCAETAAGTAVSAHT